MTSYKPKTQYVGLYIRRTSAGYRVVRPYFRRARI